jgi:hypothetical protein
MKMRMRMLLVHAVAVWQDLTEWFASVRSDAERLRRDRDFRTARASHGWEQYPIAGDPYYGQRWLELRRTVIQRNPVCSQRDLAAKRG